MLNLFFAKVKLINYNLTITTVTSCFTDSASVLLISPNIGTEELSVNKWEKSNCHYFFEKVTLLTLYFNSYLKKTNIKLS